MKEENDLVLQSINDLIGNRIEASDGGVIGRCRDVLFDDRQWVIRYLVVDTGGWLPGRKVVVSPYSLLGSGARESGADILVRLTKEEIGNCPPIDEHSPISRQYEETLALYYGYPFYWGGAGFWGGYPEPVHHVPLSPRQMEELREKERDIESTHLRSAEEVRNYRIKGSDGEIGHAEDFLAGCSTWALKYLVVDTRNWLPGRKVIIASSWIEHVDWHSSSIQLGLTCDAIKSGPGYDPDEPVTWDYEERLHEHYGLPFDR